MALAAAGLRRKTPLAATALFMAANAPDVDVVSGFVANYESVAFRRGWTHGVLALALWPFVLTAVLLAWDRYVRRKRKPDAAPARAGPLLALTAIAVVSHPLLDWLNDYGVRWLMPFSGRWFYGDALVVVDPWVWLVLGGAAMLTFSKSFLARLRWAVLGAVATVVVISSSAFGLVPKMSVVLWLVGVAAILAIRRSLRDAPPAKLERAAQAGLFVTAVYMVAMVGASAAARSAVRAAAAAQGIVAEDVMVSPAPADPFRGKVVVMTSDEYYTGTFDWLAEPRLKLDGERIARPRGVAFELASQNDAARRFLVWSRYPAIDLARDRGAIRVTFTDVRYRDRNQLEGPKVYLPASAVEGGAN